MISRPEKLRNTSKYSHRVHKMTYAIGMPCNWMGVGLTMHFDRKYPKIGSGIFMSYSESAK
jgi:hypothetical protein